MIWMGIMSLAVLAGLWISLRRFGREGLLIAGMLSLVTVGGAGYMYWNLGAYDMSLSADALNALPDDERAYVIAQAAQDEFLSRNRVANQDIVNLFQLALDLDPNQVTALGSLGIISFEQSDYAQAVDYWTQMLALLPPGSDEANAIEAGIARARERADEVMAAKAALPPAEIAVTLDLSIALPDSMQEATVFLFAREVGGAPRPVAAKRIPAAELPLDTTLSSADALMGGLLHEGMQVDVVARLTLGDASGGQGDWFSDPMRLTLAGENQASLVISPPTL